MAHNPPAGQLQAQHGSAHQVHDRHHGHGDKDPDSHVGLSWIFHFIDIIYVGAVYSIGQLFEQCGTDNKVFFVAASYMGIMFTTRYQFDQYAYTFSHENQRKKDDSKPDEKDESHEFVRVCFMILYCMAIYSMTLNIAFKKSPEQDNVAGHFGHCVRNIIYDNGFAASFLCSRVFITILYFVKYLSVLKKSIDSDYKSDFLKLLLRKTAPTIVSCGLMCMIFADVSPVISYSIVAFVEFFGEFIGEAVLNLFDSSPPLMPDPHHLQERLGLFFMLILGETMVGTLFVFYNEHKIRRTYGSCLAAFILVTAVGMQFFERAQTDVHMECNKYGEVYDERDDYTRLISYVPGDVRPSIALRGSFNISNIPPPSLTTTAAIGDRDTSNAAASSSGHDAAAISAMNMVTQSIDQTGQRVVISEFNHHPLLHPFKLRYAWYVALHAVCSFAMLVATTGIIEIYYEMEGFNPSECSSVEEGGHAYYALETEDTEHHYFHLKAQVIGGLVTVWLCMMFMEFLQPAFYNSFRADFFKSKLVDQGYTKFMFFLRFIVIGGHLAMFAFSNSSGEGNYFIGYNAMVASLPSFVDIVKIIVDWARKTKKLRIEAARKERESMAKTPEAANTNPVGLVHNPLSS